MWPFKGLKSPLIITPKHSFSLISRERIRIFQLNKRWLFHTKIRSSGNVFYIKLYNGFTGKRTEKNFQHFTNHVRIYPFQKWTAPLKFCNKNSYLKISLKLVLLKSNVNVKKECLYAQSNNNKFNWGLKTAKHFNFNFQFF